MDANAGSGLFLDGEPNPGGSLTMLRACVPCGPSGGFAMSTWNTNECRALLTDLESLIAWCMDEIFELAKTDGDKDRKMELVALEYRARLLLKRWKQLDRN